MKKVTVIGGGTGTFVTLSGLKKFDLDLGVIVSMMDSGGSTGKLRDQLGVLPPGDLRQCLVALSDAPELWRKLFLYRFEQGDLKGHNFGNLFISVLEKITDNYEEVIEAAEHVLKTKGEVIPVTFDKTHLCAEYENGKILVGEGQIDENDEIDGSIKRAYLEPAAHANVKALKRIRESDVIVIGPGDLYTSIIPVFLTEGIKEAIQTTKAKLVFVANLMTKKGQTYRYTLKDHVSDLEQYVGRSCDTIVVHNGEIPPDILQWYIEHGVEPVKNDISSVDFNGEIIQNNIIDDATISKSDSDAFVSAQVRSILRHDSDKLAKELYTIIQS